MLSGLARWLSGKEPLPMKETRVWSLFWEDPLEKEMATHSSILTWEIPQTEGPGRLQSMGSQRGRHNLATKQHNKYGSYLVAQDLCLNCRFDYFTYLFQLFLITLRVKFRCLYLLYTPA